VCDSKAWKHIDNTWLDFVMDLRNIILGLSLDEVNPGSILLFNYNLPRWSMTIICDVILVDSKEKVNEK
jgi:hypothetical protein